MINVHSGDYWNNTYEFLMKERSMIERTKQRIDCLRIDEVQINPAEDHDELEEKPSAKKEEKTNLKRVTVLVGGDFNGKKARVHAWAFKFYPYDL